jgi:hypothetical protein
MRRKIKCIETNLFFTFNETNSWRTPYSYLNSPAIRGQELPAST